MLIFLFLREKIMYLHVSNKNPLLLFFLLEKDIVVLQSSNYISRST